VEQSDFLLFYLFLVRITAAFLVLSIFRLKRSRIYLTLFLATTIYALSPFFMILSDSHNVFGLLSGISAALGIFFILTAILNLEYKIKPIFLYSASITAVALITIFSITNNELSEVIVLSLQAVTVILSLIAVLVRKKHFKKRLDKSYNWFLAALITGNLVIGVHLVNIALPFNVSFIPTSLTFLTSLILAIFFVQLEYSIQSNKIRKANKQLIEEAEKLDREKARQTEMISNIADVIAILDYNAVIKYISPNVEKLFGWKPADLIGRYGFDYIHPSHVSDNKNDFNNLLGGFGRKNRFETVALCKDGQYRDIDITVNNLVNNPLINGILINYHDISDQKRLESEKAEMEVHIRNQQALESIGTFAAGVAHEINNPVNGIMNYAQLIKEMPDSNDEMVEYTGEIIHETKRVANLVKDLLRFARRDNGEYDTVKPEEIINGTLTLIRTILKHDQIDLRVSIEPNLPFIECKSQQIQQVLMNMLTNARDALNQKYPEYDENKICKVSCSKINKGPEMFIRIMVEDHGCGIAENIRSKLFNPFFTTKPRDKGTGLGMSISYRIANEHNGILDFESVENEYTKFFLDLPLGDK